jgi:hypothetical protein
MEGLTGYKGKEIKLISKFLIIRNKTGQRWNKFFQKVNRKFAYVYI